MLIDALRQPSELERLKQFLGWALPQTWLSQVVALEIIAGARTPAKREAATHLLGVFARRSRIVAPSGETWSRAATILSHEAGRSIGMGWQNDVLLACVARESRSVLISNDADFAVLRTHVRGLRVVRPYPKQHER